MVSSVLLSLFIGVNMFGMFTVTQYISYFVEIYESYSSPYHFCNLFWRTTSSKISQILSVSEWKFWFSKSFNAHWDIFWVFIITGYCSSRDPGPTSVVNPDIDSTLVSDWTPPLALYGSTLQAGKHCFSNILSEIIILNIVPES